MPTDIAKYITWCVFSPVFYSIDRKHPIMNERIKIYTLGEIWNSQSTITCQMLKNCGIFQSTEILYVHIYSAVMLFIYCTYENLKNFVFISSFVIVLEPCGSCHARQNTWVPCFKAHFLPSRSKAKMLWSAFYEHNLRRAFSIIVQLAGVKLQFLPTLDNWIGNNSEVKS